MYDERVHVSRQSLPPIGYWGVANSEVERKDKSDNPVGCRGCPPISHDPARDFCALLSVVSVARPFRAALLVLGKPTISSSRFSHRWSSRACSQTRIVL